MSDEGPHADAVSASAGRIEAAADLDALPVDDARTAWEREALRRFLVSAPDIPEHIVKDFEVALWGACHVLRLMRDTPPPARVTPSAEDAERRIAEYEARGEEPLTEAERESIMLGRCGPLLYGGPCWLMPGHKPDHHCYREDIDAVTGASVAQVREQVALDILTAGCAAAEAQRASDIKAGLPVIGTSTALEAEWYQYSNWAAGVARTETKGGVDAVSEATMPDIDEAAIRARAMNPYTRIHGADVFALLDALAAARAEATEAQIEYADLLIERDRLAAEVERLTALDGATELGEQGAWPSDAGQFAARWNARDVEQRNGLLQLMVSEAATAERCLVMDHDGCVTERDEARAELAALRQLALNAASALNVALAHVDGRMKAPDVEALGGARFVLGDLVTAQKPGGVLATTPSERAAAEHGETGAGLPVTIRDPRMAVLLRCIAKMPTRPTPTDPKEA
jgi:hypothetical protein